MVEYNFQGSHKNVIVERDNYHSMKLILDTFRGTFRSRKVGAKIRRGFCKISSRISGEPISEQCGCARSGRCGASPVNVLFNYAATRNTCPLTSPSSSGSERACNSPRDDPSLGDARDLWNFDDGAQKRK